LNDKIGLVAFSIVTLVHFSIYLKIKVGQIHGHQSDTKILLGGGTNQTHQIYKNVANFL